MRIAIFTDFDVSLSFYLLSRKLSTNFCFVFVFQCVNVYIIYVICMNVYDNKNDLKKLLDLKLTYDYRAVINEMK